MNKGRVSEKEGSYRRQGGQGLTDAKVSQRARCVTHSRDSHKAWFHIWNKGIVLQNTRCHMSNWGLTLTEGRASQKAKPHRMQGLTESNVSQRVQHYEQRQGLREGTGGKASQKRRLSQTAGPDWRQGPTCERRLGLIEGRVGHRTEGKTSHVRESKVLHVTKGRVSHMAEEGPAYDRRQGLTRERRRVSHMTHCKVSQI